MVIESQVFFNATQRFLTKDFHRKSISISPQVLFSPFATDEQTIVSVGLHAGPVVSIWKCIVWTERQPWSLSRQVSVLKASGFSKIRCIKGVSAPNQTAISWHAESFSYVDLGFNGFFLCQPTYWPIKPQVHGYGLWWFNWCGKGWKDFQWIH